MSAEDVDVSVRSYLSARLTELLPETWRIIDHQELPATIDRTTVVFKIKSFTKLPEAPRGNLVSEIVILVASPLTDAKRAEIALDDDVLALCTALDMHPRINWDKAEKVKASDNYYGWDVTVNVISTNKKEETP